MSAAEPLEGAGSHRRRGRRDRALAEWRRARAVELRIEGCGYDDIAREVGYANRGTAHRVVQQVLNARTADGVDQLRAMEKARLDALQRPLWDRAMAGHLPSVRAVHKIIVTRIALLGLSADDPGSNGTGADEPRTVVMPPGSMPRAD